MRMVGLVALEPRVGACGLGDAQTLAQGGTLPVSTREHRDIVDKIAAGNAAAAGRALYDHVMASRERMHKSQAVTSTSSRRHLAVITPRKSR